MSQNLAQEHFTNIPKAQTLLHKWYTQNRRPLPWREGRQAYNIWISEVMLQQTTVAAVVPYYERFIARFKDVKALAAAPLEQVLESWAGLGYYSRARNLHKAAQWISQNHFPQTAEELIELSGFGPYTSRAVASIAFGQKVGVLDGNVIRVLCRFTGLKSKWWLPKERNILQSIADQFALHEEPHILNQAMMELGATVCTPQSPTCALCPVNRFCQAFATHEVDKLPLKKPRRANEIWLWEVDLIKKNSAGKEQLGLVKNDYLPFLKSSWIFPGKAKKLSEKPKSFEFQHSITHHQIFVKIKSSKAKAQKWVKTQDLPKVNPSSLLKKVLTASSEK